MHHFLSRLVDQKFIVHVQVCTVSLRGLLLLWGKGRMDLGDQLESGPEVKTAPFVG